MQKEKQIFFNRYYAWCISARNCRFSARKVIDVMDGNLNCLQFHSSKRYPLTSSKFARVLSIFLFFFLEGSLFFNRLKILVFRVNYHVLQCYPGITLTRDHCCSPFLSLSLSLFFPFVDVLLSTDRSKPCGRFCAAVREPKQKGRKKWKKWGKKE